MREHSMDGILNIYKEQGFTSHDVVAKLRGILHQKKIGHTGTLDPEAVGVLPVCLGKATRACGLLTEKEKEYEAVMLLGTVTDTQDLTGNVLEKRELPNVTKAELRETIASFVGEYDQIPPMYSAVKVQGKRLYELAREGKEVERKPRRITIFDIGDIRVDWEEKTVQFRVSCSKGTYIRTLCHDIGKKLGCGACMKSLRRTKAGNFKIEDSLTLSKVEELAREGSLDCVLVPVDTLFPDYPKVAVEDQENEKLLANGNPLRLSWQGDKLRIYRTDGQFAAIYEWRKEKRSYFPEKMF